MQLELASVIDAVADSLTGNVLELTELDAAIGDGDHGLNMCRGGEALRAEVGSMATMSVAQSLCHAGHILAMTIGGAAGPLYGSMLMAMGKTIGPEPGLAELGKAMLAGVQAIERIGKVVAGQKTMLDVWKPVSQHVALDGATVQSIRKLASEAAAATVPMVAMRGRASHLGERSIGHMDPGARSSELMILAVLDAVEWNR